MSNVGIEDKAVTSSAELKSGRTHLTTTHSVRSGLLHLLPWNHHLLSSYPPSIFSESPPARSRTLSLSAESRNSTTLS